jgi:uncharacterized membrane protein SirB2
MLGILAAILFAVLSTLVCLFQIALVMGAPWGELTLGGRYKGAIPYRMRFLPMVALVLIGGFAVIVLSRAGVAFLDLEARSATLVWIVVAYYTLGVLANYMTPSRRERILWFPVATVMLACSLIVALP